MADTLVYTLPGCDACERAKAYLAGIAEPYREILIDNPLIELGVRSLFKDRQLHAPVVLRPAKGAYVMTENGRLARIVQTEAA